MTREQERLLQLEQELAQAQARIAELEAPSRSPFGRRAEPVASPDTDPASRLLPLLVRWPGLAAVLDHLPMAIAILDAGSGQPIYVNASLQRMLPDVPGQPKDLGRYLHWRPFRLNGQLYPPQELPWVRALQGQTVIHEEMMFLRTEGRWQTLTINAIPVRDAQGEVVAVVGTAEEVARRRPADPREPVLHRLMRLVAQGNLLIRDPKDQILYWSQGAERLYGFTAQEAVSRRSHDLLQTRFLEPLEQIQSKLRRDGRWEGELMHTGKDGRPITVASEWLVHYDDRSKPAAILEVNHDITDRKRMQEALETSYQRIRRILDSITDCYCAVDPQWRFTAVNEKAAAYMRRSREQLIGGHAWDLLPPLVGSPFEQVLRQVQATRVPAHEELPSRTNPGRWIELHVYPSAEGLDVYFRDITPRKQTEQALQESEAKLRAVLASSPDAVYRRDLRTDRYDYMNLVIEQITGSSIEEVKAMSGQDVLERIHPDDRPRVLAELALAMQAGKGVLEYRFQGKDGRYRYLADHFTVQKDAAGQPLYYSGIVRDITDRQQAERQTTESLEHQVVERTTESEQRGVQLQRLAIELTQAEQRERQRLAQVLHDHLQQLLVAAKIRAKVLQMGLKGDPLQEAVGQVQDLVEESINVSRSLTLDLRPPILQETNFTRVLHWLADWMEDKHGLHVQVQAADPIHLPSGDVRYLLFRAVRELLFNVVKHAGTDRAIAKMVQADNQVQVTVADQGRGFDRAGGPADRTAGGFGLASLRERLEMLGGQIRIDSRPGRGTQVTLRVPADLSSRIDDPAAGPGKTL